MVMLRVLENKDVKLLTFSQCSAKFSYCWFPNQHLIPKVSQPRLFFYHVFCVLIYLCFLFFNIQFKCYPWKYFLLSPLESIPPFVCMNVTDLLDILTLWTNHCFHWSFQLIQGKDKILQVALSSQYLASWCVNIQCSAKAYHLNQSRAMCLPLTRQAITSWVNLIQHHVQSAYWKSRNTNKCENQINFARTINMTK